MASNLLIKGLIARLQAILITSNHTNINSVNNVNNLIQLYNSAIDSFSKIAPDASVLDLKKADPVKANQYGYAIGGENAVEAIQVNINSALAYLEEAYNPTTPEEEEKLKKLREQVEKIGGMLNDPAYASNLDKALDELAKGDDLAATLIASRVIDVVFKKIENKDVEKELDKLRAEIKTKIDEFKKKSGIPKEVSDVLDRTYKNSRNYVEHDIHIFPEPSDAYELVGGTITIVNKLKETLNKT